MTSLRRLPTGILYAAVLVVLIICLGGTPKLRARTLAWYENAAYAANPSAARAFAYGERHFDAGHPADYDIARADYFFKQAAGLDPALPYVYHELARIQFLQGDFPNALILIDLQIALQGDKTPNSYYIRGLIEGYAGDYKASAKDYAHFLVFEPNNWAAINDYSWVLLKDDRPQDAADALSNGLALFPDNAWLLNSNATALYELGRFNSALESAVHAKHAAQYVTEADWLHAYPGNDPKIAATGVAQLKASIDANMHTIALAVTPGGIQ